MNASARGRQEAIDAARRGFVNVALCTPAAALGALLAPPAAAADTTPPETQPATRADRGYHETEHIRTYYALAARF